MSLGGARQLRSLGLLRTSQDFSLCRIISSPMMSSLMISCRISSLLSSHHTVLAQFISCHHISSLLISSHLITPINRIPFHLIASYHILSSLIISNIIYHHFPHFSSSIFFNPVKNHCPIMHSFPPPPWASSSPYYLCTFQCFNATVLFNEHQTSINQGVNQRPEVLWIRTGFDLRQTWAIASTYQLKLLVCSASWSARLFWILTTRQLEPQTRLEKLHQTSQTSQTSQT